MESSAGRSRAGIDIINDGELGKSSWATYILERVSGFEIRRSRCSRWSGSGGTASGSPSSSRRRCRTRITGGAGRGLRRADRLRRRPEHAARHRQPQRRRATPPGRIEAFLPVVAPASAAFNGVNEYYAEEEEYVYALAEALRHEYLAISEPGFLVQVDDAVLANMYDDLMAKSPEHYRKWAELRIEALNHALRGHPEDRVRYHLCYGSWHAPHVADAPLEEIVDLILRVNAGAYSIEAANVRHEHEWRVWEDGEAAGRQDADPRRRHPPHDLGRAPAAGRRPHHPLRPDRRPRERDRRHGLRLPAGQRASSASTPRSCGPSCSRWPKAREAREPRALVK